MNADSVAKADIAHVKALQDAVCWKLSILEAITVASTGDLL
jgi:hypothetical protein